MVEKSPSVGCRLAHTRCVLLWDRTHDNADIRYANTHMKGKPSLTPTGVSIKALAHPLNATIEDPRAVTGRLNKAKHVRNRAVSVTQALTLFRLSSHSSFSVSSLLDLSKRRFAFCTGISLPGLCSVDFSSYGSSLSLPGPCPSFCPAYWSAANISRLFLDNQMSTCNPAGQLSRRGGLWSEAMLPLILSPLSSLYQP
jgi:hypothetical protein